jgi:IclR family pca regulon transcriptional regulator
MPTRTRSKAQPKASAAPRPGYFSHSLARGLQVIKAFDRDAPMLRITDVARRTGLPRAAARRFLMTLVDLDYVGASDDMFYLRPRALEIGYSYLASINSDRLIQPFLNELTAITRETSTFGVLDGFDIRLIARSASNRMLNYTIHLGGRVPAYGTSLGRVLMATLPPDRFDAYWRDLPARLPTLSGALDKTELRDSVEAARVQQWAAIEEHHGQGVSSIAVPIQSRSGLTIAAVNVVEYPPKSSTKAMQRKFLPLLRDAAQQISQALSASHHVMAAGMGSPSSLE